MSTIEITTKAREYRELQAMIRELEAEAEAVKAAITAELDALGVDTLQADIFTIKHTAYQSTRIDSSRLKAEHPDLYSEYSKTVEARRFQVA